MGSGRTGAHKLQVLIIDEGHSGHGAQSRGFVHCARMALPTIESSTLSARLRTPGAIRLAMLRLAGRLPRGLPQWVLRMCYDMPVLSSVPRPELIVSSGGQGAMLASSLARRYGVRWIFCGDSSGIPRANLDIVVSPLERHGDPLWLRSDLLFCDPLPDSGQIGRVPGERLAAVLIGGPSRSHHYDEADWVGLVNGLHQLAEGGWRFLITTSARTPKAVEGFLRHSLDPGAIRQAVWWRRAPEKLAKHFLAAADLVLVTQDSLTMTSEAVAARKPVLVLMPFDYRQSVVLEAVLGRQEQLGRLFRCQMTSLPRAKELSGYDFRQLEAHQMPKLAARALALAGALSLQEYECS